MGKRTCTEYEQAGVNRGAVWGRQRLALTRERAQPLNKTQGGKYTIASKATSARVKNKWGGGGKLKRRKRCFKDKRRGPHHDPIWGDVNDLNKQEKEKGNNDHTQPAVSLKRRKKSTTRVKKEQT